MKSGPSLWCALFLLLGFVTCRGIETTDGTPVPPAPPIAADDQFFVDHPDLKDETEIVNEASGALTAEGWTGTPKEASEALAAKSRAILAERTPEEWQQKAVRLYPALGGAGSDLNLLFIKHYRELKASSPEFIQEPSWPVLLAKRCDEELREGNPAASETHLAPSPAAASLARQHGEKNSVRQTHRSTNFWQTFLALLLLIILTALPAIVALRPEILTLSPAALGLGNGGTRQRASSKPVPAPRGDPPIWRVALKHAAVVYVVVALPSSVHSLMTNSDLGFIDRLFVSLLVGALFGLCITLPLYGLDTLWQACQKHPARPATR
jgi:hypothetical protein